MATQLSNLFLEGGPLFMSILTLLLALLFLAAWKAPAWVRDIGNIALVLAFRHKVLVLRYRQLSV